jgi:hypothetical protein
MADKLVSVRNRNNGTTGYTLDNDFHRNFNPGETLRIPFSELERLQYAPGGQYLLDNYLVVESEEALENLNMEVEPEYFYDENTIKELLLASDNIDAFEDFLNFAPNGAIELAKTIAVKEQIPDVRKRNMLSKKTGLNISNAIMVNEIMNAEEEKKVEEAPKRKAPVEKASTEAPKRKAPEPEKKIVVTK